jgi:cell division protein FtsB
MAKKSRSKTTARVRILAILIVVAALLFTSIAPVKQIFSQRAEIARLEQSLENLKIENKNLSIETERLNTDAYIEQQARLRLGLMKPGEEPYMIVPPKQTPPSAAKPAPKPVKKVIPKTWWQDAIDYMASLFK